MDEDSQTDNKMKSSILTANNFLCYKNMVKNFTYDLVRAGCNVWDFHIKQRFSWRDKNLASKDGFVFYGNAWSIPMDDFGNTKHGPLVSFQEKWLTFIKNLLYKGRCALQCAPTLTSIQDLFQPNSRQTPVAAVTVYSAPEDGRKGRPKHVEHTCSS